MSGHCTRSSLNRWSLIRWSLCWLILVLCGPVSAMQSTQASVPGASVVMRVDRLTERLPEGDPGQTLDAVRSPERQAAFVPLTGALQIRSDGQPIWLRITLDQAEGPGDWLLALPTTAIHELSLFGPFDAAGQALAQSVHTGLTQPYQSRPLSNERYVFRVRLPAPGEYTAYLRVVAQSSRLVGLSVWDPATYLVERQDKRLFDGLAYGILLTLLIYNLVLAVILTDRTYGLYVLNCGFALLTIASFNGHAARYLFPDWPFMIESSYAVAPCLWMMCSALFGREFLQLRRFAERLDRLNWLLVALIGVGIVLGLLRQTVLAQRLVEFSASAGVLVFFAAGLLAWSRGHRPALWYLAGQSTLFVAVLAIVFVNWGLFDSPFITANGLQVGILLEMVVFSIALSGRIRGLHEEKRDLEGEAGRLAVAVRTDALTGLANRVGLEIQARALLTTDARHGLMLIDLDRFKPVNDRFGHLAGDRALTALASRIASAVREGDVVARVGGDEFVVLLVDCGDPLLLAAQARRLQSAISRPLPLDADVVVQVDASVGIAVYPDDARTLEELVARADQAMYDAKRAGRTRQDAGEDGVGFSAPPTPAAD